jgi:hypothetical protein
MAVMAVKKFYNDRPLGLYSQHFIVFLTYKQGPKARVFVLGTPFQPSVR